VRTDCSALIHHRIRERGPMTFADFMGLALYEPEVGYYARAVQRSGRAGDFLTSVDVGPIFGELLAGQIAEMWQDLGSPGAFDLVEAGAGNGRLSRDVLEAATHDPVFYDAIRLHLVEASPLARAAQADCLGPHAARLVSSAGTLPSAGVSVMFANELLDALPAHLIVMREDGLREIYVATEGDRLVEHEGPPSTDRIADYFAAVGATLQPGWRAEVNLAAIDWTGEAARSIERGFLLLIDYGHEASELFSATHAAGTLTSFRSHVSPDDSRRPWLAAPGTCDITSHVDFTSVSNAATAGGLTVIALLDQMYFLLGLGLGDQLARSTSDPVADLNRRLALKTLVLPGGLGSTHKVLILGKGVGSPRLKGTSYGARLT
jgi:SAM-dependent MidA family methyltransferase